MKRTMRKILVEMLRDSKRSDREIAKLVGVSQPTVTRTRSKLVKEGMIKEFTVIPNLSEMGFEIMAINCFRSRVRKELADKAEEVTMNSPNILFSARCQGGGKNGLIISLHKNYTDYSRFISSIIAEGGDDIEENETYLISLNDFIPKPFSFEGIAKLFETL
ncbi:MAG: Lrp/AsnC family transcriptional regulator [Candidatus Bathyarchaeota archaeon]|nr:MAG: Lrp/AsnC family transcriptional regulator [Candidatus Bathyarchaeota archaeon]